MSLKSDKQIIDYIAEDPEGRMNKLLLVYTSKTYHDDDAVKCFRKFVTEEIERLEGGK